MWELLETLGPEFLAQMTSMYAIIGRKGAALKENNLHIALLQDLGTHFARLLQCSQVNPGAKKEVKVGHVYIYILRIR